MNVSDGCITCYESETCHLVIVFLFVLLLIIIINMLNTSLLIIISLWLSDEIQPRLFLSIVIDNTQEEKKLAYNMGDRPISILYSQNKYLI